MRVALVFVEDARPRMLAALSKDQDLARLIPDVAPSGLVPADEMDITAPSALANLHLPPLRLLLHVRWNKYPWPSSCNCTNKA